MTGEEKSLPEQLEQLADAICGDRYMRIPHSPTTLMTAAAELRMLESVNKASETLRRDAQVHHKAEISVIEDTYARTKSTMLTHVQHAQHALGKDKLNVVAYKLDVLADMLGSE